MRGFATDSYRDLQNLIKKITTVQINPIEITFRAPNFLYDHGTICEEIINQSPLEMS